MRFIYNFAFYLFALFYLPIFLVKIRQADSARRLIRERCGLLSKEIHDRILGKRVIWVHAVSVGEVLAVQNFIELFVKKHPECHIILTTVTPTGQKMAKKIENTHITACYFPLDLTFSMRRFFKVLDPECVLLMETEIWPNLLTEAKSFHVPVGILNARLSLKSARRYNRFRNIFRPLFQAIDFALVQDSHDAKRFSHLGIRASSIYVLGNMKFDNQSMEDVSQVNVEALRTEWGFTKEDFILIAGSTHKGEEVMLRNVYLSLKNQFPNLKLLLAPRHIERSGKIARSCTKKKLNVRVVSQDDQGALFDVLILDRLGILKKLYAMADVVYVGGSLVARGGQNPIEPANYKRPIIHGPFVKNFEMIYRMLDQQGGAILIRDQSELIFAVTHLLQDKGERMKLGENAFQIVTGLRGATERHIQWVSDFLGSKLEKERKKNGLLHENILSPSR